MCGYEFNIAAAGEAIAGAVLGHFYSTSKLAPSTIVHCGSDSLLLIICRSSVGLLLVFYWSFAGPLSSAGCLLVFC